VGAWRRLRLEQIAIRSPTAPYDWDRTMKTLVTILLMAGALSTSPVYGGEKQYYWALCAHQGHGTRGWTSDLRPSYEEARRDAEQHNRLLKGHDASVVQ
jgi:hypothetical protein